MGMLFRVRLSSFAGAATASAVGFYFIYKDYMLAHEAISSKEDMIDLSPGLKISYCGAGLRGWRVSGLSAKVSVVMATSIADMDSVMLSVAAFPLPISPINMEPLLVSPKLAELDEAQSELLTKLQGLKQMIY